MSATLRNGTGEAVVLGRWARLPRVTRNAIVVALVLVVLSVVRDASGSKDLTSALTVHTTIALMLPIAMCALGGLVSERAGIVNIGLEGMMIMGTWFSGLFGYHFGGWGGLIGGLVGGALGGLLHALATVTFGVDHVISGVAINALAVGWARYLSSAYFKGRGSGSETNSPGFNTALGTLRFPGMGDKGWVATIERHQWPVVSDAAGILRGGLGEWPVYRLLALLMIPAIGWLLWRTSFGLQLRSSGEKPSAADSLGVPVYRVRYIAVVISGALAGLGGALLVLNNNGLYSEGQTGGRGFIGIAALIFGNWRPLGLLAGAALFGFFDTLRLQAGADAIRGLYLAAAIALLAVLAVMVSRRERRPAMLGALAVAGAGLALMFERKIGMPDDVVQVLPYMATLIVLAVFSQRLRGPAASGRPWRKGEIN